MLNLPDLPSVNPKTEYQYPRHPLLVHEDVIESLERYPHLRKRLAFVLSQLASRGHTTITKSCNPPNQGWRRSPMGGGHGNQFYLWWCTSDASPMKGRNTGHRESVWIRAIRVHHDHSQLETGTPETQYMPLTVPDTTDPSSGIIENPRTHTQQDFVQSSGPVRIIRGHPGTGKTTTLWHAIEAREHQNVLYVTWSPELAQQAGDHFTSFAPKSCQTLCLSYDDLLTTINGAATDAPSRQDRLASLQSALLAAQVGPHTMGPWENNLESLYAEIRSQWLGRAVPGLPGTQYLGAEEGQKTACLTTEAYLQLRKRDNQLGPEAANAFVNVVKRMSDHPTATQHLQQAIPDMTAANNAIQKLRKGLLPPELKSLNRIAVDEAQDLSITEITVITELAKAVAAESGQPPWLLIAGDEAQTVQHSGFEWNALQQHLETNLSAPQEYILDTDARAPAKIAEAIARTNDLYSNIGRDIRPADRRAPPAGDANQGTVIIAVARDTDDINHILHQLGQQTGLVVISPTQSKPRWLNANVEAVVLTPQEAKGTEHRTACVLMAGQTIANIKSASRQTRNQPVDTIMTRASIDMLRVSMSRATENVVLLETRETLDATANLFEGTPVIDAQNLMELIHQDAANTVKLIQRKLKDARELAKVDILKAWDLTEQAQHLMQHALELDPTDEKHLQNQMDQHTVSTAVHIMVHTDVDRETKRRATTAATEAATRHEQPKAAHEALRRFADWTSTNNGITSMLDSIANAPTDVAEAIRESVFSQTTDIMYQITLMTEDPDRALTASKNVEKWLNTLQLNQGEGFINDIHRLAFTTFVDHRRFRDAEDIIFRLPREEQTEMLATVWYKQNHWKPALLLLQTQGKPEKATEMSKSILETAMALAERKHENQQYQEVIDITDQVLEINSEHREAMMLQIRTFQKMPDLESAIYAADQMLELEPTHLVTLHVKARLLAILGKIDEAVKIIELAVAEHPNSQKALVDNAVMLANSSRSEEALKPIHRAIAISKKPNAHHYGILANIHTDIYTQHSQHMTNKATLHREAAISAAAQALEIERTSPAAIAAIIRIFVFEGHSTMDGPPATDELSKLANKFHFLPPNRTLKAAIRKAEELAHQWNLMTQSETGVGFSGNPVIFDDLWQTD